MELQIAKEFSDVPGPRTKNEGPYSAEQFVEELLEPRFRKVVDGNGVLKIDLDGAFGYATSFLEEAFGGLARKYPIDQVLSHLEFKSEEEPYLIDDIKRYIREARTGSLVS